MTPCAESNEEGPSGATANLSSVAQRALWASSLLGAVLADAAGAPRISFYLVLAAVTLGGVVVLESVGALVDGGRAAATMLATGGLVLTLASAAARGPFVTQNEVPAVASTALLAGLVLLGLYALAAVSPRPRRTAARGMRRPLDEEPADLERAA